MRSTLSLLHSVESTLPRFAPRLRERVRASTILENVETLKYLQAEKASSSAAAETPNPSLNVVPEGNAYFNQLPKPLVDFFTKYPPAPFRQYADKSTLSNAPDANPFFANRHPVTNTIHDPIYSLRRQSDLYKAAYRFGIAHLLPPLKDGKKFYEEKYETKTPVRGSQRFKLSKAERIAPERQKEMAEAIAKADELILKARGSKYKRKLQKKEKAPLPWF